MTAVESSSKPMIKSTDMSEEMQAAVFQVADEALSKYKVEKVKNKYQSFLHYYYEFQDVAVFIKEQFDQKYGTSWHCVVGRNFGSFVSHETNCFIYFYLNNVAIMLFKTAF